jgi:hypothetical protein
VAFDNALEGLAKVENIMTFLYSKPFFIYTITGPDSDIEWLL